jgi:Restriction endonuclease AspBHI N-terminal/Restriction endonuclease
MMDVLRYGRDSSHVEVEVDGFLNFHYVTAIPGIARPKIQLEAGINTPAQVAAIDGPRRPLIAIRSSPWKAGHSSNPWHDEFDLDHGRVRYFGDHKPSTVGLPGATVGNRALLEAWSLHAGVTESLRASAPPLLLFRSKTIHREKQRIVKGHVEFCGVAVIERLEHVVQRDSETGQSFPNLLLDLAVLQLTPGDAVDMRWVDDRRDPTLTVEQSARYAPESWQRWVREGRAAIPRVRRRVFSSPVKSSKQQLPDVGSIEEGVLDKLYRFFDGRKHAFELLASQVAAHVLGGSGAVYRDGWLTRAGGDGGMDFVGRLDVGSPGSSTPLVVLGQAKCVAPQTSISPDQVARVVARLRRGWIGVFVTTGTFSRQAQVEVMDDQYPLVLIDGRTLVDHAIRLAAESHGGDVDALLASVVDNYESAITYRRPEEILFG